MRVFVVMGTTGEYSDRSEWPVKAFVNEKRAESFALAAKQEADRLFASNEGSFSKNEIVHSLDPECSADYTGTDYYHFAVDLDEDPS